ncbi:PA0069 family radical SAM protein [Labrys okinawensis]|uniref:PA0069 family radical SAM protein n=1 Tax=Labrys okinawensis TaxID=346911 RepID=UPI0039BCA332
MPPIASKGRASQSNASGRFEGLARESFDDGWCDEDMPVVRHETTLTAEKAHTILSRNDSPDLAFDRSINPYRGCEHGCIYCFARPSHAYLGLSPGLDFETKLFFKPDAAALLDAELRRPGYRVERVQLGANTDPYQPIERRLGITRAVIEVLQRFNHPLAITTKSVLVTRDIDILAPMAERGLAMVAVSITTLDRRLARSMEPRASTPERRLDAIRQLSAAGIPVVVGVSPMIPGLSDHEMETIMERAAGAGATGAYYSTLRLSHELKDLFREWLAAEQPGRATHVMSLVRQLRGGRDNDPRFGKRMTGEGPLADLLARRFDLVRQRLGLSDRFPALDTGLFRIPARSGDQLSLL